MMSCNIVTLAQAPGDENESEDLEDVDPAPIDEELIWLTISGISLACYALLKKQKNVIRR